MGEPDEAWPVVHEAILAFGSKVPDLGKARAALLRVIRSGAWRHYVPPVGRPCDPPSFREWVMAKVPRGLETTEANLHEIAQGHKELSQALDVEFGRKPRTDKIIANDNNVHVSDDLGKPDGNSRARALRKLRKDAPELHAEVLADRISAHAAMVQAGFRPKTISVPVSRPESVAKALRRHLDADDIAAVIRHLLEDQ